MVLTLQFFQSRFGDFYVMNTSQIRLKKQPLEIGCETLKKSALIGLSGIWSASAMSGPPQRTLLLLCVIALFDLMSNNTCKKISNLQRLFIIASRYLEGDFTVPKQGYIL